MNMIKKIKQMLKQIKKKLKRDGRRNNGKHNKGKHFQTPASQKAKKLLLTGDYNDIYIADATGLSRERIRQFRNRLGLKAIGRHSCTITESEEIISKVIELSNGYTKGQIAKKLNIRLDAIKAICDKHNITTPLREWKVNPERFKKAFEHNNGIIKQTAEYLGISVVTAVRYCRALKLKSRAYNAGCIPTDSKYDDILDDVVKEIKEGKPMKTICEKRNISQGGLLNHLMYKGVTVKELRDGKEIFNSY
jgi:DNA-binding CsgD family transcriptional regulator